MLGRLRAMVGLQRPRGPARLPAELVTAIENAHARARGEPDPETGERRVIVTIPGLAPFYWGEGKRFDALLSKRYPELSPEARRRATALMSARITERLREQNAGHMEGAGRPWVWAW